MICQAPSGDAVFAIQENPLFRDLRGILVSRDAQPFYAKFGFEKSDRGMVKPAKES